MSLIRGGDGEWQAATICNRGYAGSSPTPASNFAVPMGAQTPTGTFNHTQPKLYGPKQPELYTVPAVLFQTRSTQQWTNNKNENSAV